MKKYYLYRLLRPLNKCFMKTFFRVQIIGSENIKKGNIILAGNHTSYLDPLLIMASSDRTFRFLAKKELQEGIFGFFFKSMGTIAVNRGGDTSRAKSETLKTLNEKEAVVIFPEGTINKSERLTLPFKKGVLHFAKDTNSYIVPFIIKGKYKLFRKSVSIKYLKPYKIKEDLNYEREKLMNKIKKELIK